MIVGLVLIDSGFMHRSAKSLYVGLI